MATLFFAGLVVITAAAGTILIGYRARTGPAAFAALVVAGCIMVAASALDALAHGGGWEARLAMEVPGGAWIFGIDALSAFFLLAVSVVGAAAAVYGVRYLGAAGRHRAVAFAHAMVALLLVALALVVTARAAVPFLIAWELMAVTAFLLVMFDHELGETRRAGLIYLAATHTATLALIALFAVWQPSGGDLSFATLSQAAASSRWGGGTAVLLLALAGFGLKAGVVPLHFWLPGAHAAAPSHVSALMSGLVIKTGIYGLLRVAALIGHLPEWYAWTLLLLGVGSGILGVVWALAQHDLKRLLAYHSVENIGIILIGMGAGALGSIHDLPVVAALGYGGAILHVLNHALFKSLLFLGAGSLAHATGTRTMDALGGVGRLMPVTEVAFVLGSAAIVGLPPLNGFVSEWTIVRGLLAAGLGEGAIRAAIFGIAALGLIGGLALACFAKVIGVVFLGRPRTAAAAAARESGPTMYGPMLVLALACVLIGLLPAVVLPPALAAARVVAGPAQEGAVAVGPDAGRLSAIAAVLAAGLAVAWLAGRRLLRGRWRIVPHAWACGYPAPTPRMQYTAASFASPLLEPFGGWAGRRVERSEAGIGTHAFDLSLDGALLPAWRRLLALSARLQPIASGRLHVSLLFVLATVILLLSYLVLRRGP